MRKQFYICVLTLLVLLLMTGHISAEQNQNTFVDLVAQIKKAVVFIGRTDPKGQVTVHGTGCLLRINEIYHVLTARHVLFDGPADDQMSQVDDHNIIVLLNRKDGTVDHRSIQQIKKEHNVDWVFHPRNNVDLAIIPFVIDPKADDVKSIPESLFFGPQGLHELYDVFFLSFQPGVELGSSLSPVIRKGTISRINPDGNILIDGFAFPGNSGSPVFLTPASIRFDDTGGIALGGDQLGGRFIGIIGGYLPYQDVAVSVQTGRPRLVFEENTGLSIIWPVKLVRELLESENFQKQIARVKPK